MHSRPTFACENLITSEERVHISSVRHRESNREKMGPTERERERDSEGHEEMREYELFMRKQ